MYYNPKFKWLKKVIFKVINFECLQREWKRCYVGIYEFGTNLLENDLKKSVEFNQCFFKGT